MPGVGRKGGGTGEETDVQKDTKIRPLRRVSAMLKTLADSKLARLSANH